MLTALREGIQAPCALLLGGFDGLHLGHRRLLAEAKKSGLPVGITTIWGGKGKALFTREEREYIFARSGIGFVLGFSFTPAFRNTAAEDFLRDIFSRLDVRAVYCGEDFRFGKDALGTPELLKRLAPCPVFVQPCVQFCSEGETCKLSASVCKELLLNGELSRLNGCLCGGEDGGYFIGGEVEHGRQVGRMYGFPTLNLAVPPQKLLPPDGVYGGLCETPKGNFSTIVNIGARPTFGVEERKIEAYLDGFSGDLYGETVRVYPMRFLRPIMKFSSADELKAQLGRDIKTLRMYKKEGNV